MAEDVKRQRKKGPEAGPREVAKAHERYQKPGAQGYGKEADAIDEQGEVNEEKLRENREKRLNVDEEHETPDMKKKDRGTYP